ncbi:hypothetical protein chiPu_0001580 [Chiloscyllium punctatum]|uniref:Melanin-concentrating hormone n=1 Tax=Chiloscyllium punctatum TaxID=137246 RepID=A0A401RYG2_CHIPU|nr:hypothetical protein [Chiloscyllium punctatum]
MNIAWMLVSGLFLVLLPTRTAANPLFRSQSDHAHVLDEELSEYLSSEERDVPAVVNPKVRFLRDLSPDTRSDERSGLLDLRHLATDTALMMGSEIYCASYCLRKSTV